MFFGFHVWGPHQGPFEKQSREPGLAIVALFGSIAGWLVGDVFGRLCVLDTLSILMFVMMLYVLQSHTHDLQLLATFFLVGS